MPLAFPSHQGLILPLWQRWPHRFDALALCVGAAMPDVVDGLAWFWRGQFGQWLGHSLLGVVVACTPLGWPMVLLARRVLPPAWSERLRGGAAPAGFGCVTLSLAVGALSHLAFDFVSHGNFLWSWPWHTDEHWFPAWWYRSWAAIPLPGYREPYPFAPHTVVWVLLSGAGIWLFLRALRRGPRAGGRT